MTEKTIARDHKNTRDLRVAVFEDSELAIKEYRKAFAQAGYDYQLYRASRLNEETRGLLASFMPNIFIIDLFIGEDTDSGLRIIEALQNSPELAKIPVIVWSSFASDKTSAGRAVLSTLLHQPNVKKVVLRAAPYTPPMAEILEVLIEGATDEQFQTP
jgi:CheY-like chemotaxis protein